MAAALLALGPLLPLPPAPDAASGGAAGWIAFRDEQRRELAVPTGEVSPQLAQLMARTALVEKRPLVEQDVVAPAGGVRLHLGGRFQGGIGARRRADGGFDLTCVAPAGTAGGAMAPAPVPERMGHRHD